MKNQMNVLSKHNSLNHSSVNNTHRNVRQYTHVTPGNENQKQIIETTTYRPEKQNQSKENTNHLKNNSLSRNRHQDYENHQTNPTHFNHTQLQNQFEKNHYSSIIYPQPAAKNPKHVTKLHSNTRNDSGLPNRTYKINNTYNFSNKIIKMMEDNQQNFKNYTQKT